MDSLNAVVITVYMSAVHSVSHILFISQLLRSHGNAAIQSNQPHDVNCVVDDDRNGN